MSKRSVSGPITATLVRGLDVLEALAEFASEGAGLTRLSEAVGLDKATTSRLVNTLCATGFAYQDPASRRYRLTAKVLAIGTAYRSGLSLSARAARKLASLREATDETVHLGILEVDHIVYISKLESTMPIKIASAVGQRMPLHTTALGKAILAVSSPEAVESLLEDLDFTPRTERSITSVEALHADLAATRERGYSIDDRENENTITCVGAAIVDAAGEVHGALSVSGPSYRMIENIESHGELARQCAEEIGATL